jgi:hypothetical protein
MLVKAEVDRSVHAREIVRDPAKVRDAFKKRRMLWCRYVDVVVHGKDAERVESDRGRRVAFGSVCDCLHAVPEGFEGGDVDVHTVGASDEGSGDRKDDLRLAKLAGTRKQDSDRAWFKFGSHGASVSKENVSYCSKRFKPCKRMDFVRHPRVFAMLTVRNRASIVEKWRESSDRGSRESKPERRSFSSW